MQYFFEKVQNFKFLIIDGDGSTYDTIGSVETTMGKLMGAKKQMFTSNLSHEGRSDRGQLIVRTQAVAVSNEVARLNMKWNNVSA